MAGELAQALIGKDAAEGMVREMPPRVNVDFAPLALLVGNTDRLKGMRETMERGAGDHRPPLVGAVENEAILPGARVRESLEAFEDVARNRYSTRLVGLRPF